MTPDELLDALITAPSVAWIEGAVAAFEAGRPGEVEWAPVGGKENNRGPIEVSMDPGRALVERLTNGLDAVLEAEFERHGGVPDCRTPKEAAAAWLNVPSRGLAEMTTSQRQTLARSVTVRLSSGEGREARIVEVRDTGIGLLPDEMPDTILSLNESNKIRKHYLAGTYGQGGSSTLAVSRLTLIASRRRDSAEVGFTLVKFLDLPPDAYKTGHYVYMTLGGRVLTATRDEAAFPAGTLVRHVGYDLSPYPSPLGPTSVYGLLNQVMFDPVLPIWLDSEVHGYRRVIKGSRNALNGAVDEGDENRRGPTLDHNIPMFYPNLGDFGRIGIEYWVLEKPTQQNKRPSAAFVDPGRPIVLTINGQNHAELTAHIVRKESDLPYLTQRLIVHIDCNSLTPAAKRALFVSSREDARRGQVLTVIHDELVRVLRSDDELTRLNNEAREAGMKERDQAAMQEMRREVARLLRLQGVEVGQGAGSRTGGDGRTTDRPTRPRPVPIPPQPLPLNEPPTFIRIVWPLDEPVEFYPGQRRYLRLETDANSDYHNAEDPRLSRINVISSGVVRAVGSTPLRGGRMRTILEVPATATVGAQGAVRVELMRPGLPLLFDERPALVGEPPPTRPTTQQLTLPPFEPRAVSPQDEQWAVLGWPEALSEIASEAIMEEGVLVIYYSTAFPKFAAMRSRFEQRSPALAQSFTTRYEIWLATHSLIYRQDQEEAAAETGPSIEDGAEAEEEAERRERIRIATLAALFAGREVDLGGAGSVEVGEDA